MSSHERNGASNAGRRDASHESDLASTAAELDKALCRFEELCASFRRTPLDSQKSLERAAQALSEAMASHDRVGGHVRDLVAAVAAARDRQQAAADALQSDAMQLQRRTTLVATLFERFGVLGEEAKEINGVLQTIAARKLESGTPNPETLTQLEDMHTKMGHTAEKAAELAVAARAEGVADVAQQADSLRQQLYAARNRLGLLQRTLLAKGALS